MGHFQIDFSQFPHVSGVVVFDFHFFLLIINFWKCQIYEELYKSGNLIGREPFILD